ncbi:hypothetical protein KKE03_02910 [Patescibacteria group bacterium]|nr:hypothetical protein [Patescibacteria group bacterium]
MTSGERVDAGKLPGDVVRASIFQDVVRDLAGQDIIAVENGLYALGELGWVSPRESIEVLGLASRSVAQWVTNSDPELVMSALSGSFATYVEYASQQDDSEIKKEFMQTTGVILAGMVKGKPKLYEDFLSETVETGLFGIPKIALASGLLPLSVSLKEDPKQTGLKGAFTKMLNDFLEQVDEEDKDLLGVVKSRVPISVIIDEIDSDLGLYPRVAKLAKEIIGQEADTLAAALVTCKEENLEFLIHRIGKGEFGDPLPVFPRTIIALYNPDKPWKEEPTIDLIAQELWLSTLDYMLANNIKRSDPRLDDARREIIGRQWYWGLNDNIVYSALDALGGGVDIKDLASTKTLDAIVRAAQEDELYDKEALARIAANKEKVAVKLGKILEELEDCDRKVAEECFSNSLLVVCLDPGEELYKE